MGYVLSGWNWAYTPSLLLVGPIVGAISYMFVVERFETIQVKPATGLQLNNDMSVNLGSKGIHMI